MLIFTTLFNTQSIYILARVCSLHFEDDCLEIKWTKPRANNVPAKIVYRLRKNSVPSKLLNLEKKRKNDILEKVEAKKRKVA